MTPETVTPETIGQRIRKATSDIYFFSTMIQLLGTPEDQEDVLKPLEKTCKQITMKAAMVMARREMKQAQGPKQ
jgi:hypothetical protein